MTGITGTQRQRLVERPRVVADEHRRQPDIAAIFLRPADDIVARRSPAGLCQATTRHERGSRSG
jgi:hypothetical protein